MTRLIAAALLLIYCCTFTNAQDLRTELRKAKQASNNPTKVEPAAADPQPAKADPNKVADPKAAAPKKAAPPAKKAPPPRPEPTVANYKYGNDSERQVFDFWQAKSDKPTPVMVFIHGGGWVNGDKTGYGTTAIKPYLDAGISVASVNYRFINQAMEQKVEPPVKACVTDAGRAIQTIRSKAKEWNIDPKRIAASGGSAGACTSLWLALHDDLADPKSADPIARESTRLTCAAVEGAQTSLDPKELREWMPNITYGAHAFGFRGKNVPGKSEFDLLIENREKVMPWIKEYSPIELVSSDDPPIFLNYGSYDVEAVIGEKQKDATHSAIYGVKLQERLKGANVEAVLSTKLHPDKKYGTPQKFVMEKLGAK